MRTRLRAFQTMRGTPVDPDFIADLEFLENRDLDLSVRLGALLAFNALMATIGTHPVSASPGAPLSLDAASQPVAVIVSLIGILPFVISSAACLWALLVGEEIDPGELDTAEALRQRLFSAFIASIDVQERALRRAVIASFVGGLMTIVIWAWILVEKMA
jgi:hypothetical protein